MYIIIVRDRLTKLIFRFQRSMRNFDIMYCMADYFGGCKVWQFGGKKVYKKLLLLDGAEST